METGREFVLSLPRHISTLHNEGAKVKCYSLSGKSVDGIEFNTNNLYFNSVGRSSSKESGSCMSPKGGCSSAEFHRKLSEPISMPPRSCNPHSETENREM